MLVYKKYDYQILNTIEQVYEVCFVRTLYVNMPIEGNTKDHNYVNIETKCQIEYLSLNASTMARRITNNDAASYNTSLCLLGTTFTSEGSCAAW